MATDIAVTAAIVAVLAAIASVCLVVIHLRNWLS